MRDLGIEKKVILITGTRKGIGRYLAEYYVNLGHSVIGCSRSPTDYAHENYDYYTFDLSDETDAKKMFLDIRKKYRKLDVLINNAGIHGPQVPVEDYPLENWQRVIAVDLTAVFICTQAVVPHMKKVGYGRIVTIASQAGKEGVINTSAYNAAKAGVIGFMKGLSK